jgi:hypothetical protein
MLDVVTASRRARRHLERVDWVTRGEVDLGPLAVHDPGGCTAGA